MPMKKRLKTRFKDLMSRTTPASMTAPNPLAHWILWCSFAFIIVFVIWAYFAELEEVTVANATVIPLTHVQSIQNMEGGIIKEIVVHEGDIVDKGEVLVYLDPTRFTSALEEAKSRAAALEIKIARLKAEVNHKPFVLKDSWKKEYPDLSAGEQELFAAKMSALDSMKKNYDLAMHEYDITQPLVKESAASAVDVMRLQREGLGLKTQMDDYYAKTLTELGAAEGDLSTLTASMLALQDRLDRTIIRAPVKGIVKEIRIPTNGGVVLPGMEIMSIVPLEDTLLIQAEVAPSKIGFVRLGAIALVKVTAYDYSVYGGLSGIVKKISADTVKNAQGHSYYLVRIQTTKNFLRSPKNPLYIIPGMTATVNILTGRRTVLNYILNPIIKARDNALRER